MQQTKARNTKMFVWNGLLRFYRNVMNFNSISEKEIRDPGSVEKKKEEKENRHPLLLFLGFSTHVSLLLDSNTCLKLEDEEVYSLLRMANSSYLLNPLRALCST